jgi:hypothetical protein
MQRLSQGRHLRLISLCGSADQGTRRQCAAGDLHVRKSFEGVGKLLPAINDKSQHQCQLPPKESVLGSDSPAHGMALRRLSGLPHMP